MANRESILERSAAASDMVAACEESWRAVQQHHPSVPDVVVVLGTGVERGRLVKLGHWWSGRWLADGQVRGEVLLAGEALHLHPGQVFEVLLHEAAHGLNATRGVRDASRGGRYHNGCFKATAEELGLVVAAMPPYGWAQTSLGPEAAARYRDVIAGLGEAMRITRRLNTDVRVGEAESGGGGAGRGETATSTDGRGPAMCGCGRKMRMAPSVLAKGPVLCGLCGHEFSTARTVERSAHDRAALLPGSVVDQRFVERRRTALGAERAVVSTESAPRAPVQRVHEPTELQRVGLRALAELAATASGVALLAEVGVWRESQRNGGARPLLGWSPAQVELANNAARALLKFDGELPGEPVRVAGRELVVGDWGMVEHRPDPLVGVDGCVLPPAGVLGTIVATDAERGELEVGFSIAGPHRLAINSAAAAAIAYGYAEHVSGVGAPLLDVRTLPDGAPSATVELAAGPEWLW